MKPLPVGCYKGNHYYPFGLVMAGINSKAVNSGGFSINGDKPNSLSKGFNGNERQENEFLNGEGLFLYDFNARFFDAQIGRFNEIDPLSDEENQENLSTYQFSYNNPVTFSDPSGKCPCLLPALPAIGEALLTLAAAAGIYKSAEFAADGTAKAIRNSPTAAGRSSVTNNSFAWDPTYINTLRYSKNTYKGGEENAKTGGKGILKQPADTQGPNKLKKGPAPNGGKAPKHGGDEHNDQIDNKVDELYKDGNVLNIRKNQVQVDKDGYRVGDNKPDVQFDRFNEKTKSWEHHIIEYDTKPSSSVNHGKVTKANDNNAQVELIVIKK